MDYYKTLGLDSTASQSDIKKAYFRLIRQHSPENDPEGFRKIREAYEYLKKALAQDEGPSFPPFKEPIAKSFADQVTEAYRCGDYRLARDTAQEGHKYFPDDLFFLYWLVITQRKCGNTGNAVKNAEKLVKMDPENRWFWREYGISLKKRGFMNKAYGPLRKAYEMGIRDLDFAALLYEEYEEFGDYQKAMEVILEVLRRETKWNREEALKLLILYREFIDGMYDMPEYHKEILNRYCSFVKDYRMQLKGFTGRCIAGLRELFDCYEGEFKQEEKKQLYEAIDVLESDAVNSGDKEELDELRLDINGWMINHDDRLCYAVKNWNSCYTVSNSTIHRYVNIERKLFLLKQREEFLKEEDILKNEYPELYEEMKDILPILRDEEESAALKDKLLPELARAYGMIKGFTFFEVYPDEKEKAFGTFIASGDETYKRQNKKIGRNDPCPCGSGKKFKKCCMGKGIYD